MVALAERLNPFSRVHAHRQSFGHTPTGAALADELVDAADVVLDTTGFHSVTRLLHRRCAPEGTLLVSAALSVGGYGGRIVALRGARPCFDCFLNDGRIPVPALGEAPNRVPYGCSHAAASCAGFDVLELVANVARTAIRLVPGIAYPPLDFDWAVLNFRSGFDRWTQGELLAQADCPMCA
jgi:molybdopterin/thiamine biosynthesis adenylyltransferase